MVETVQEVAGKLVVGHPKTKAGRRTVALPRAVANELAAHLEHHAGETYVFATPRGLPLREPDWRRRYWLPAIEVAGLAPLRCHDLRHTALDGAGSSSLEGLLRHRISSFRLVHLPRVAALLDADFALLPTFNRPRFTVRLLGGNETQIARLLAALGPPQQNPYYGPQRRSRR